MGCSVTAMNRAGGASICVLTRILGGGYVLRKDFGGRIRLDLNAAGVLVSLQKVCLLQHGSLGADSRFVRRAISVDPPNVTFCR